VKLLDEDQINVAAVDSLIEQIATKPSASVIDNGSASFAPMGRYLVSNGIAEHLAGHGRRLVLHAVVIGGQPAVDTIRGLVALLEQFPKSVPWWSGLTNTLMRSGSMIMLSRKPEPIRTTPPDISS
jgi:hypothetical protein